MLRHEQYRANDLQCIIEILRDPSGDIRFRREEPPGVEVENRLATPVEQQRFLDHQQSQALKAARARLESLTDDDLEGPVGSIVHDLLIMSGRRPPQLDIVTVIPDRVSVAFPGPVNVEVRLDQLPQGLSGYTIDAVLEASGVGNITDVIFPAGFDLNQHRPDPVNGPAVSFSAADTGQVIQRGARNALIATLEITGAAVGRTPVALRVRTLQDETGDPLSTRVRVGSVTFT